MKFLSLLLFTILISSSCCGSKETTTKEVAQVETLTPPEPPKTIEVIEIESEVPPIPEESITKTVVEVEKIQAEQLKNYQVLTKRILTQHELWNELLKKHVSEEGNVNYNGFKKDHGKLLGYIRILQLSTPNDKTSKNHKLAYWINAYNAMTIDLILRNYPIKSIKDIDKPWKQRLWKLGDTWYNLEDIEHQILRKMNEPRIHFAINCASISCPKLSNTAYTSEDLNEQLEDATKTFVNSNNNMIKENNISLSKIFKWFKSDFETNGNLIKFLNQYSKTQIKSNAKIVYFGYNWNLNE